MEEVVEDALLARSSRGKRREDDDSHGVAGPLRRQSECKEGR